MNPDDKKKLEDNAREKLVLLACKRLIRKGKPAEAALHYRTAMGGSPREAMVAIGLQK